MNINFEQNKDPYGYSYVNCFYNLKKDYVFISIEGNKKLYLKRWAEQANKYSPGWILCEEKKKVANGNSDKCIQHVIYKKISNTNESFFL